MLEALTTLITCISPIIVAYFGYIATRQQKQTKEFIELQTKYNQQNEAMKKQEAEEQKQAIKSIKDSVDQLQHQFNELNGKFNSLDQRMDISRINDQLNNILELSHVNFEYSQSLSEVICAIGDCIETANVGKPQAERFQKGLERRKEDERKFVSRILKIAY